jgi:hypothetical protein
MEGFSHPGVDSSFRSDCIKEIQSTRGAKNEECRDSSDLSSQAIMAGPIVGFPKDGEFLTSSFGGNLPS